MINIVTTFYVSDYKSSLDEERTLELVTCLLNNVKSHFIEKIHLFVENNESLDYLHSVTKSEKIVVIKLGKKPIYTDFFQYILNHLKNKICMITNADIYLEECNDFLIKKLMNEKIVYALTRYEYDMTAPGIKSYGGSHDCYIFNSSFIDKKIINDHTNHPQNSPGIETHIIKNFCDQGFKAYNPCYQIKIIHLHKTDLRRHTNWIGLHKCGDFDYFKKSCWCVPPIEMK